MLLVFNRQALVLEATRGSAPLRRRLLTYSGPAGLDGPAGYHRIIASMSRS